MTTTFRSICVLLRLVSLALNFCRSGPCLAVAALTVAFPTLSRAAASSSTNCPLYLLTYDHGGVVLWGPKHFAERLRDALAWLDRYPGFKLGLDNEAYLYDYLAEAEPALLEELRGALKKYSGRFGIGSCTYGQPLSTFINEESNIRQIAFALRADRRQLGTAPDIYLMSEHAMHSQLPQILAGFGFHAAIMRTHFMMYGYNPTFDVPIGWWVGLDGSRLPAIPTYPGEGAEFMKTTVDNWFLTRYPGPDAKQSPEDFRRQFAHLRPLLATRADDSGLRKEELVRQSAANPDYHWVLLEDLLPLFPKPTVEMRTLPNDFTVRMPWGYCGNEIWDGCRRAEVQVLTAERLAAMELILGGEGREPGLERAWKNLLVAQHHDVQICGLLPDARKYLAASLTASTNAAAASLRYVASRMTGSGLAQVTVFNPLSWPRNEWMETELDAPASDALSLVVRHAGTNVPATLLPAPPSAPAQPGRVRLAFLAQLPPLGFAAYSVVSSAGSPAPPPARVELDPARLLVSTPWLQARLDLDGGIASLIDRRTGTPLLQPGKRSAFFAGRINGADCESKGRWTLQAAGDQAPWAVARESGSISNLPYTFEIRFRADSPRLDCRATFHLQGEKIGQISNDTRDRLSPFAHEHKLRFKLFPGLEPGATGVRDLPFAISETTNRYVEGLYWTALAGQDRGVAFFNRGTMGAVRETDGGFSLPLAYSMYYIWGTRMLDGDFSYEFAVVPFPGAWRSADLHRQAIAYNFPVVSVSASPGAGVLPDTVQPLELGSPNILLSALYPDSGQLYLRLYESAGASGQTSITSRSAKTQILATDLAGASATPAANPIDFHPWQIRTFRLNR